MKRLPPSLRLAALTLPALLVALTIPAAPTLAADGPDAARLAARRQQMLGDLASLRFERLGDPVLRWDHIPPVEAPAEQPHELLVVLVEYPDARFDRFDGDADQGTKLAAWYQEQLFDPAYERPGSLSHYYLNQSLGLYHLQGKVLPPVRLSKPRAAYGAPLRPEGGTWRNDTNSEGMVEEALLALVAAHKDLDWAPFDRWDPNDYDGDGVLAERDGYLDHFVLVFAGGGQSSCQRLYKLDDILNPNAAPDVLATLSPEVRACAERMWPHRFMVQKRTGEGPVVEGRLNARGGVPLGAGLWARDYNMQSEYTDASTFIHEFGHSIGLPDIYARTSQNSTGAWEVMSGTASPLPQSMSAWSRMMLGWLRPFVVTPPEMGGKPVQSTYLRVLDDPPGDAATDGEVARAAMIVLPPKTIHIDLGGLPAANGKQALYSGQGNELDRVMELRMDLTGVAGPLALDFDAWWDIEGGWDFAYLESTVDGGRTWKRHVTEDRRLMPAKHGHDGGDSLPGFTGLSGDMDGDGKNEQQKKCDPKKKVAHGEDAAGAEKDPCAEPSWVHARVLLTELAGYEARVRLRYFTDMAAVQRGIMIDNLKLTAGQGRAARTVLSEDFEGEPVAGVRQGAFTPSAGRHTLLVPHYYVLELRDPYAPVPAGEHRYDAALADPSFAFYLDPADGTVKALSVRSRPGVLAWYYDGELAWSENDPATAGQGRGFLLSVDAWPDEVAVPGWDKWLVGTPGRFDTGYDVADPAVQSVLEKAFLRTQCFVRSKDYRPRDLGSLFAAASCAGERGEVEALRAPGEGGKPFLYSYEIANRLLPGEERERFERASELLDYKVRGAAVTWRMRDVSLRYFHATDAPFSLAPFEDHVRVYGVKDGQLVELERRAAPAVPRFENAPASRWVNPKLFFGGVAVPPVPLAFELAAPAPGAPADARVKVYVDWNP